jgi:hypothetical protein
VSRKLCGLQNSLPISYINNQVSPYHDKEFALLNAGFNSVAGFDDGSHIPKTYKDVLKHKNQKGWWDSMKKEIHAM